MISKGRRITAAFDFSRRNSTKDWQAMWGRGFGARVEEVSEKRSRTPCEGICDDL